jgi:hypothetical protein
MSKEFTFTYDATEGILTAAALRQQAKEHRREASEYRKATGSMASFYAVQAIRADNRAQLLEDAADAIHAPVKKALAADMDAALRNAGL